jgi:acyl-CoA thioesterase-2
LAVHERCHCVRAGVVIEISDGVPAGALGQLLSLVRVGPGEFRSEFLHGGSRSLFGSVTLYGGQILAQALAAAAQTAPVSWHPHSLHGYFLRPGAAGLVTCFSVSPVRDGRSFAVRTVQASQEGRQVFVMTASFHAGSDGPSVQDDSAPPSAPAWQLPALDVGHLFGVEARLPAQETDGPWPARYWARCTGTLPAASSHACALAYISDTLTPLMPVADPPSRHGPTISHSIWFHRPVNMHDWVFVDLKRITVSSGIGCYRGSVYDTSGQLVASLSQEATFRLSDRS